MKSVVFTGNNIKHVESISDEIISIPAINTSRIQEAHILVGQILCNALEAKLGLATFVKEQIK
jgi:D-sedoheptulose 7-phosphate isomerase